MCSFSAKMIRESYSQEGEEEITQYLTLITSAIFAYLIPEF